MNFTLENTGELTATIQLSIVQDDYAENYNKAIKDFQKKANMKGFRPGKVPISLVQSLYGKEIVAEEVNKLLSERLPKYLKDNNINIIGQPLPNEEKNTPPDFENKKDFDFFFDIGFYPEFTINYTEDKEYTLYDIIVDDEMLEKEIENLTQRYGTYIDAEKSSEKSILHGMFNELLDSGEVKPEGINSHTNIHLSIITDEELLAKFKGLAKDDKVIITNEELQKNEAFFNPLLKLKEHKHDEKEHEHIHHVSDIKSNLEFVVESLKDIQPAILETGFFEKIFPQQNILTTEEFKEKFRTELQVTLSKDAETKLTNDVIDSMIKANDFALPVNFLKRFLLSVNEKMTEEKVEHEFEHNQEHIKWEIIETRILTENKLEITEEEITNYANQFSINQLMQYGFPADKITLETIKPYTDNLLKKEENYKRIYDTISEKKVTEFIKSKIKTNKTQINYNDFIKIMHQSN